MSKDRQWPGWLLAVVVSLLLLVVVSYFIGRHRIDNEGCPSPDKLVERFVGALEGGDVSPLDYCFHHMDQGSDGTKQAISDNLSRETGILSVDVESAMEEFYLTDLEPDDDMSGSLGFTPSSAKIGYVSIPMERSRETGTYSTVTHYFVTMYEADGRWFLFNAVKDVTDVLSGTGPDGEELDPYGAYRYFNDSFIGGDEDMGLIPLDDTWYRYDPEAAMTLDRSETVQELHYMQESGNACIHMVRLDTQSSVRELADQLAANLSADEEAAVSVMAVEDTVADRDAIRTEFYAEEQDLLFISWLVDTKDYDGTVRYLSLECTPDYADAYLYLYALTLV